MWELRSGLTEIEIEQAIAQIGFEVHTKGTLNKYLGSVHWHLKAPGSTGTAEITLWPLKSQCWAEVRGNRSSPEILELASRLVKVLR